MSLTAEQMQELLSAGLTAEQMVVVAKMVGKATDDLVAKEEERKQRSRDRKRKERGLSRDSHATVTRQSRDSDVTPVPPHTPPLTHIPPVIPPKGEITIPQVLKPKSTPKPLEYPPEFEEFWGNYPKTACAKREAYRAYNQALKTGVTHAELVASLGKFKNYLDATGTPAAHPTTFLNQQRWSVDYDAALAESARGGRVHNHKSGQPTKTERAKAAAFRGYESFLASVEAGRGGSQSGSG